MVSLARPPVPYRRKPQRDWGRLVARLFCLVFGVIGAVPFSVGLLVRTPVVRAWAARETAAVLERELGLVARYRVEVQAWPLSIGLSDVRVEGSDGIGAALEAARIAVRPRLFSLMSGRLDAGHIEIDGPRARLVMRNGELTNVSYRLPKTDNPTPVRHAPFISVAVTDGAMDLDLDGVKVRGRDVDVDVTAEDGPVFDIALRAGEHSIVRERDVLSVDEERQGSRAVDEDVLCQLDARLRIARGSILVRRLALQAVADLDENRGSAASCDAPAGDPRRVEIALSHVQAALPANGDLSKIDVEGSLHARGPLPLVNRFVKFPALKGFVTADFEGRFGASSALPVIRGKLSGTGLELDQYRLMSELSADLAIEDDVVRADRVAVGFGDGTIVARNLVVEPLKKGAPIRIGSSDATNVRFAAMMRDLGVTPHAHVNWSYRATHVATMEGTLVPLKLDADFNATTGDFEVFDKAVDDPARRHMIGVKDARVVGHVGIRPDAVTFHNSRVDFGESHIEASVSLGFHNDIALSVAPTSRVELANISPIASLKMAGKATLGAEMKGKFNDPLLTGDLAVSGFSLDDFPLGDITSSKVRFRPLTVDFSDLHAKKGKSSFDVPTGRLDFNGPATLLADAVVDATDLYLRDFLHMWHFDQDPRFDQVDGHGRTNATIHYDLGGSGDVCGGGLLQVRGNARMSSMDLFGEHYDGLDSDFSYNWRDRDAAALGLDVDIRSLTLKKGRGSIFGSGTIRRGGIVRAQIVADDVPLSRMQAMGSMAQLLEGSASAVGTVGGTIDELEADIDVKVSPIRMGTSVLPASKLHVGLVPLRKETKVLTRTRCGQPVTAPFDRAEYDRDASQGTFHTTGDLFGGQVIFDDFKVSRQRKKITSGDVVMKELDLSALGGLQKPKDADASSRDLTGSLTGALSIAALPLDNPEQMRATLELRNLDLRARSGKLSLKSAAPVISIGDDKLALPQLDFEFSAGAGLKGTVAIAGEMKRLSASPEVNLSAKVAPIELSSLASLIPRVDRASGWLEASLNVTGKMTSPAYVGEAHLKKGELAFRGVPMPLSDMNVDLAIGGGEVRIVRGIGTVGGGSVSIAGRAPIHGFRLGDVSGAVTARGVSVPIVDGIAMTCDADLRAEWNEKSDEEESSLPRISGDITLTSFSYTRPIGIGTADINAIAQRDRRKMFDAYDPADDFVTFDVQLKSKDPLRLRNNLVEAQLLVDSDALVFSGTNQRFGLRGRMRILPGGRIRLRSNEFEVRQGYVRFDNATRVAPNVDITAVTDYRRYSAAAQTGATGSGTSGASASSAGHAGGVWRITLHAYGDADNLRLDMTSEPALSQEDILLLLTIGMTRAEVDQLQASSIGGTVALEALSSLTGADSAVKKAVPVIDDFRLGSAYSSRTGRTEATVTLGKRLTDKVRANVTSGLSENREIRSNLEWKLTPRVSVQGSYDNVNDVSSSALGNLGADVRWRLEFE
jgi:translocation and assembly module TamB